MNTELKCNICGNPATIVCSSVLGAISHAYCPECANSNREVWTTLVGGLFSIGRDNVDESLKKIIQATCEFYNKTEDDLWAEVDSIEKDYEEYCRRQQEAEKKKV